MVLSAIQLVRFCVCVLAIRRVAGKERRRRNGSIKLDYSTVESRRDSMKPMRSVVDGDGDGNYEFGRHATRKLQEFIDLEKNYRELLEVEIMVNSMSMSMSMSMAYDIPSPPTLPSNSQASTPPSSSPIVNPSPAPFTLVSEKTAAVDSCIGQASTSVTASFEVELAVGKEEFTDDLLQILGNALSIEYPLCTESRRGLVPNEGDDSSRQLQQDSGGVAETRLGAITILETDEGCVAQSVLASSCRTAKANIEIIGGTGDTSKLMGTSLESITADNEEFENDLMMKGIVAVRVVDPTTVSRNETTSSPDANSPGANSSGANPSGANSSEANPSEANPSEANPSEANPSEANPSSNGSSGSQKSRQTTLAIVLSVVAVSLVLVAILRRGPGWRRRRNNLSYVATMDEEARGGREDENANRGSYSDEAPYGFADPTPIASSTVVSC